MPSTILSDNGVSSGSAGLKTTAASDGSLALQTTTSGGTATTAVRIDTSQNVGIGVTPSAWNTSRKVLQGTGAALMLTSGNNSHATLFANTYENTSGVYTYQNTAAASYYQQYNGAHSWYYAASGTAGTTATFTQAMTLDANGRLGVNRTSPGAQFDVLGAASVSAMRVVGASGATLYVDLSGGGDNYYDATNHVWRNTSGTERARIDSGGNFLVATASAIGSGSNTSQNTTLATTYSWFATNDSVYIQRPNNTNGSVLTFFRGATNVGSITVTASATAYNTSSDYRLKNTIAPMTGALAKISLLKPCTYKWNADGSDGEGFIAHELAEVVPQCVTGEKDAVDEDGNPKYQGIDTSFLVATLTAAIQELKAEFDAYKATHP